MSGAGNLKGDRRAVAEGFSVTRVSREVRWIFLSLWLNESNAGGRLRLETEGLSIGSAYQVLYSVCSSCVVSVLAYGKAYRGAWLPVEQYDRDPSVCFLIVSSGQHWVFVVFTA